jgi:hypothetical protein
MLNNRLLALALVILLGISGQAYGLTKVPYTMIDDRPTVSPVDFGADNTGATSCVTQIASAQAHAVANGAVLFFPPGTYNVSDSSTASTAITILCDWIGAGSTSVILGESQALNCILNIGSHSLTIANLSLTHTRIDSGTGSGKNDFCADNLWISGVNSFGMRLFGERSFVRRCRVNGVIYGDSNAADGVLLMSAQDSTVEHCDIRDFRRIGVVSDTFSDGTKANNVNFLYNTVASASNCDESDINPDDGLPSEYNAAIWIENTNSAKIIGNHCSNISGGVGQSTGKVTGLTIGGGADASCTVVVRDNVVDGAITVASRLPNADISIVGNRITRRSVKGSDAGIAAADGAFHSMTVTGNTFVGFTSDSLGSAILSVGTTASQPGEVVFGNNKISNTITSNGADIGVILAHTPTRILVFNQPDLTLGSTYATASSGTVFEADTCGIRMGATNFRTFETQKYNNCTFLDEWNFNPGATASSSYIGCTFLDGVFFGALSSGTADMLSCVVHNGMLAILGSGSSGLISGSRFFGSRDTSGAAIDGNFYGTSTSTMIITGCYFENGSGTTAIQNATGSYYDFGKASIANCVYDYDILTDLTATDSYNTKQ